MKNLITSIDSFENMIQGKFLYVDKTEYVWRLIEPAKGLYFLSRPRRFGKSLLLSTLKAVFEGKKELFQGLALYDKPYDWEKHPVIHLDLNGRDFSTPEKMEDRLQRILLEQANDHKVQLQINSADTMFHELIKTLHDKFGDVVILLDEYDKPILNNISEDNRQVFLKALKAFYSVIKEKNDMIRLVFITGVSKFSHVSLFSDLNNLTDITLDADFAEMLGFTEQDIRANFADRIPEAAKANGLSEEDLMQRLLIWYDGYRFSEAVTHVCNPVSVTSFFKKHYRFANYWGTTGMPTFLFKLARTTRFNFEQALSEPVSELAFNAYDVDSIDTLGLLWQTGYLTIKETLPATLGATMFRLGFPDYEVEQYFNTQLLAYYSGYKDSTMSSVVYKLTESIRHDEVDTFMKTLQAYFASIPYDIRSGDEHYYQTIFFITFLLLGCSIEAESRTNEGRIDAFVRTDKAVYIFEFKLDKTAEKAVSQIVNRHYYERFQACGLPLRLIGVDFDSEKGRIDGWQEQKSN